MTFELFDTVQKPSVLVVGIGNRATPPKTTIYPLVDDSQVVADLNFERAVRIFRRALYKGFVSIPFYR